MPQRSYVVEVYDSRTGSWLQPPIETLAASPEAAVNNAWKRLADEYRTPVALFRHKNKNFLRMSIKPPGETGSRGPRPPDEPKGERQLKLFRSVGWARENCKSLRGKE
jgi:hypothetical protein